MSIQPRTSHPKLVGWLGVPWVPNFVKFLDNFWKVNTRTGPGKFRGIKARGIVSTPIRNHSTVQYDVEFIASVSLHNRFGIVPLSDTIQILTLQIVKLIHK